MADSPVAIALLEPSSGPAAYIADGDRMAAEFVAEEINSAGGLLGRQLQVIVCDTGPSLDSARSQARELLADPRVIAISSFGVELARSVALEAEVAGKLYVSFHTVPAGLTGPSRPRTTFSCVVTREMQAESLAWWLCREPHRRARNVFLVNQDYEAGRTSAASFDAAFARFSGPDQRIVGSIEHATFDGADMSVIVDQVMGSGADTVMSANWGSDLERLLAEGHRRRWDIRVAGFHLNYPMLCQTVREAAVGHLSVGCHMSTLDTPRNLRLVSQWRERFAKAPVHFKVPEAGLGRGINCWRWLAQVIEKTGAFDAQEIACVWEGDTFQAPWGDVWMDPATHQMASDCAVASVQLPASIPTHLRWFDHSFPYLGPAEVIGRRELAT